LSLIEIAKKYGRRTANINVKKLSFYNNVNDPSSLTHKTAIINFINSGAVDII